jgi:hypothetical protein
MKKLLFGVLLLGSVSSFANCNVLVQTVDGAVDHVVDFAKKTITKKGYTVVYDIQDANYTLALKTLSRGSTQEYWRTVGASTVLTEVNSGRIKYEEHKYKSGFYAFRINRLQRTSIATKQIKGIPACNEITSYR